MATLSDLKQDHKNARKRTQTSASLLQESLQRYGPARSIVIDEENRILAGNGTVEAAISIGIDGLRIIDAAPDELIAVRRTGLTEDQKVGLALADNRTADLAEWDAEMLQQLSQEHDIAPWFQDDDVEALLEQVEKLDPVEGNTDPEESPEPPADPITKPGDLWILGNHRLLCGDSTNIQHVKRLMDGVTPEMVYTDPPYGISIVSGNSVGGSKPFGSVGGSNVVKAGFYAPVAGDDSIETALDAIELIKTLGSKTQVIWGGNYYANALPNSSCWIVWDKENTGNFADAELAWTNQDTAVRIFKHMWNGMLKASERGQKRVHPTQKPVALAEWCFENYGDPKTVLDLFLGSGSTLIACEQTRRACYGMELSPAYCDVIVKRWEDFTGNTAICQPSEAHFAAVCPPPANHFATQDDI
jgi:16S rRNA G966 N2-methylase RsmD